MREQRKQRNIASLMVLLVFALFAVCIAIVLLTGVNACQRLNCRNQSSFDRRTAAQYIAARVRQSNVEGLVYPANFGTSECRDQGDTLFLLDSAEEDVCTRIYCHNGYIWELYCDLSGEFLPEDGEKILKAEELQCSLEDSLLIVEIGYENAQRDKLVLALHDKKAVG